MKSNFFIKLFPWCLALCFLCWAFWSNLEWNKTSLILFYVEQTSDRIQHKYDSVVKLNERIISDNPLRLEIDSATSGSTIIVGNGNKVTNQ